jgi:hypothetical protein
MADGLRIRPRTTMRYPQLRTLLAYVAAAAAASGLAGQPGPAVTPTFQRLTNASAERQFTARDLLGRDVYDSRGDKIGQVNDIELGSGFSHQLALALGQNLSKQDPRRERMAQNPGGAVSSSPTRKAQPLDQPGEAAVFVAVGGVLGIGDNLIRVPASALRHDGESDRLILDITKDEISRLTKSDDASSTGNAPTNAAGSSATLSDSRVVPGRDRRILQEAIANEPTLREIADRINITVNDSDVVVFGTVRSQAERTAVIGLIEKHTDKPVRDKLTVSAQPR